MAGGLVLVHGTGIVTGKNVISKGLIKIYQVVTIGGNSGKKVTYGCDVITQPAILNNVILYPGACILVPIIIGENSIFVANAVVKRDITDNSIIFSPRSDILKIKEL